MKKRYLDAMERALEAYSLPLIDEYFDGVKRDGLTEHGFARLVCNIGTMIAHGRKGELRERFIEMMSFCCEHVSMDRAANDFSIQEMIACIDLMEETGAVSAEIIAKWRENLKKPIIYNEVAKSADQLAYNWVLFSATSEFLRMKRGLCPMDMDFIDMQIATQIVHLDENGMYRDADIHPPMVYDNVSRGLFSILLFYGYGGKYRNVIDGCLCRAGLLSLKMQSVSGEIPFGGRSNQFYHNEAHLALIAEYEARRYAKEGNFAIAERFKRMASDALASIEHGFERKPIHHVKNRFQLESRYGCEDYAYFNKYMITVASFLNWARIFCMEDIDSAKEPLRESDVFELSDDFHKLFLRSGDYFAQIDTNADPHYDASGLGRIHKRGAPSEICLSCPGAKELGYYIDREERHPFALTVGVIDGGKPCFFTEGEYRVEEKGIEGDEAFATLSCEVARTELTFEISVSDGGVSLCARGDGEVALMLPVFDFDGEVHTEITEGINSLEISYLDSRCKYTSSGEITDLEKIGCNRNGHYKLYCAHAENCVTVHVSI